MNWLFISLRNKRKQTDNLSWACVFFMDKRFIINIFGHFYINIYGKVAHEPFVAVFPDLLCLFGRFQMRETFSSPKFRFARINQDSGNVVLKYLRGGSLVRTVTLNTVSCFFQNMILPITPMKRYLFRYIELFTDIIPAG
jgi:hypothetical protein